MSLTRAQFFKLLTKVLDKIWDDRYRNYETIYDKIFNVQKSEKAFEKEWGYGGFGRARIMGEYDPVQYEDPKSGYDATYYHQKYGLGYIVSQEMIDDDLYGEIRKLPANLVHAIMITVEFFAAAILDNAFVTAGYDGKALCANDHPLLNGGTLDNKIASDLDATSLEAAMSLVYKLTNEMEDPIMAKIESLIVPTDLVFTADRLMKSAGYPTADIATPGTAVAGYNFDPNDVNIIKGKIPKSIVSPYLASSRYWFLKVNTGAEDGLKFFWRKRPKQAHKEDFDREAQKTKATYRCSAGWSNVRNLIGSGPT